MNDMNDKFSRNRHGYKVTSPGGVLTGLLIHDDDVYGLKMIDSKENYYIK